MSSRRLLARVCCPRSCWPARSPPQPAHAATMYPSGVGADLGAGPTTLGVKPAAGANPAGLQTGTEQGRTYWRTNQAADTTYFTFDVDRDYVDELNTDDVVITRDLPRQRHRHAPTPVRRRRRPRRRTPTTSS